MSNIKEFSYDWIWIKNRPSNFQLAWKNPLKYHEIISVFYYSLPIYKNTELIKGASPGGRNGCCTIAIIKKGQPREDVRNFNKSILYYKHNEIDRKKYKNQTQKPVDLIRYLIRTYTNPGDIILDNCLGSGTTAIAAMREGRDYIGFEKDEQFFEMCQLRIQEEKDLMAAQADPLY